MIVKREKVIRTIEATAGALRRNGEVSKWFDGADPDVAKVRPLDQLGYGFCYIHVLTGSS